MYCSRPVARSPSAVRFARPGPPRCGGRNASFLAPFHGRFHGGPHHGPTFGGPQFPMGNELAPLFRLFEDVAAPFTGHQFRGNVHSYQPRFDVREVGDKYEVSGELPGFEGKDIEVEFSDPQTLIVRGRTEKETSSGTPPTANAAVEAGETETTKAVADAPEATDNSDAASTYSTGSYQRPSVEDEETVGQATPAESSAEAAEKPTEKTEAAAQPQEQQQPSSHYWVSERTTGSFQRVFSFPNNIDQEAVTASLKNGILNIVVPKAAAPATKKINVE